MAGISEHQKYRDTYGPLDSYAGSDVAQAAKASGLSEAQTRELLASEMDPRLAVRDQATLDLMDIRDDYRDAFKTRMPVKEFETYVAQQRQSGSQDGLRALYRDWTEPKMDEVREKSQKDHDKRIAEEAIQDFASRNKVPVSTKPVEVSILSEHMAKERAADGTATGRDAFFEGYGETIGNQELQNAG